VNDRHFLESAMPSPSTAKSPDTEAFFHMHNAAIQYDLHYSSVRTIASTLYLSFGILASVNLFVNRSQNGYGFPIILLLIIYLTTLGFNIMFASWSWACRQTERYYKQRMTTTDCYVGEHGFRHLFHRIVLSQEHPEMASEDLPPKLGWSWRASTDPFFTGILIFGLMYIIIYAAFLCMV